MGLIAIIIAIGLVAAVAGRMTMLETGIAVDRENHERTAQGDVYEGFAKFTTTSATVELPVPFRRIKSFSLDWCGTPASDEILSVDETPNTDGHEIQLVASASGQYSVTVTRTGASKTSGAAFSFRFKGQG